MLPLWLFLVSIVFQTVFHVSVSVDYMVPSRLLQVVHITIPQFMKHTNYKFLWFASKMKKKKKQNKKSPPIYSCLVSVWNDTARSAFVPSMLAVFSWPNERYFNTHLHVVFVLIFFLLLLFTSSFAFVSVVLCVALFGVYFYLLKITKIITNGEHKFWHKWWMFEEEWIATENNTFTRRIN